MFCLRARVWGDWLYKKGQKNIQTNREEDFFFLVRYGTVPRHTSVAYLSKHSPRCDNHNFSTFFLFFLFFTSPSSESARKERLNQGPSLGRTIVREVGEKERECLTRWNAQFSTPNRHRRWSSISPCRLKIWRGKNVNSLFQSLLPGKETRIHAIIIISFARGSTAKRFVSLCQKRKWRQTAERTWRRWRCARTSRGHLHVQHNFRVADLFLTRQPKSGPTISKKKKKKEKKK